MRIVFCGTPEFSVAPLKKLIENKHEVVAVYTQPDRGVGRGRKVQFSAVKQCALDNNIEVYQPMSLRDEEAIEQLRSLKPDLLVVVAYGLILPQEVLDIPAIACWNIHASLLPRWRGAAPIHRALLAGDKTTGVGIMHMEAGLDTGAVYLQHECAIADDETTEKLHDKLAIMGANALIEAIELLQQDNLPTPMVQNEDKVSYAKKLTKSESIVDWNQSAKLIDRKIRALVPWPGIVANIAGNDYKIWQARFIKDDSGVAIGEISHADKSSLFIQCQQGQLQILSIQKSGKKRMDIAQFMQAKADWFT
jgi:methionyl-tRNA formyltransferase